MALIMAMFYKIRSHYKEVGRELSLHGLPPSLKPLSASRVVIPISGVHRGIVEAVDFARSITNDITAVYVELEERDGEDIKQKWSRLWPDIPLKVVPSPYRSLIQPLLDLLDEIDNEKNDGTLTCVVLPEFVPAKWWQGLLHNQTAWLLKAALLYHRHRYGLQRIIIDVPYYLRK
jgi:hypothetical protein